MYSHKLRITSCKSDAHYLFIYILLRDYFWQIKFLALIKRIKIKKNNNN